MTKTRDLYSLTPPYLPIEPLEWFYFYLEDMDHFGDKERNTKMFAEMPNLKVVSTVSAGYDHLDFEYLKVFLGLKTRF